MVTEIVDERRTAPAVREHRPHDDPAWRALLTQAEQHCATSGTGTPTDGDRRRAELARATGIADDYRPGRTLGLAGHGQAGTVS